MVHPIDDLDTEVAMEMALEADRYSRSARLCVDPGLRDYCYQRSWCYGTLARALYLDIIHGAN